MQTLSTELSLSAQASYSEMFDAALANDMAPFSRLTGAFHKRSIRGHDYIYFGYRDIDGTGRMAYVGPNSERVQSLVANYKAALGGRQDLLKKRAAASKALGCTEM